MSRKYYYFAASLPTIAFGDEPPSSTEDFLKDCERLLHVQDYFIIQKLLSKNILDYFFLQKLQKEHKAQIRDSHDVFQRGLKFNRSFRNELAFFRAEKAGKDPSKYIRGDRDPDPNISEIVNQADKASDPLEGEKILDRARWNFLDELATGQYFNLEYIIIFGLKLAILERYKEIRSEKGKAIFEEIKKIDIPQ